MTKITCQRYRFFVRRQERGKRWITSSRPALRSLAQTCDFRDTRDSLILDCIVLGVADQHLIKRLMVADSQRSVNIHAVHQDDGDDGDESPAQVDTVQQRSPRVAGGARID